LIFKVFNSSVTDSQKQYQPGVLQQRKLLLFSHTNRNHALAIIIQILHQRLTQTVHLPLSAFREIPRQEPILLLEAVHQIRQLLNDALVHAEVLVLGQDEAKVEDELVPVIAGGLHADGVAQDAISACAYLQEVSAELLSRDHEEGYVGEGEEGLWLLLLLLLLLRRSCCCGGDDGTIGDLVDNFWTCIEGSNLVAASFFFKAGNRFL
jgi:hypothetical protein